MTTPFHGLFFTSTDCGFDGPYENFSEAAEDIDLLTVRDTTERIWVDFRVNPNSGTDDDEGADVEQGRKDN